MHLDPTLHGIVEGVVAEGAEVERGVELAVQPREDVQIEVRRHTLGVVVRGVQQHGVLSEIGAKDYRAVRSTRGGDAREEPRGIFRVEVADRGPREESHAPRAGESLRERNVLERRVVRRHRMNGNFRVASPQFVRDALELRRGHIDGHVCGGRRGSAHTVQYDAHLLRFPAPVLHEHRTRTDPGRDRACVFVQDGQLGARQVVLIQPRYRIEERGAARIVEQLRREPSRALTQAGDDLAAERRASLVRLHGFLHPIGIRPHQLSLARRIPLNCQRVGEWKKLRYVRRACERGVATDAPRSTHWSAIHFPLYSPIAPAAGR